MEEPTKTCASFLGIPIELRLTIYSYVRVTPIHATVLNGFHDGRDGRGFRAVPVRNEAPRIELPWLNLMLTSRTIAAEMNNFTPAGKAKATTEQAQTYELSITAGRNLEAITWTRVPCAPHEVRALDVTFHGPCHMRFWGDGGPRGIVRSLYQTLNVFLHCGPMLPDNRPLKKHIHLEELAIRVDVFHRCEKAGYEEHEDNFCVDVPPFAERRSFPSWHPAYVQQLASSLCQTGLLSGYVDRVVVYTSHGRADLIPTQVENARVPEAWNRYGFEWGVERQMDAPQVQEGFCVE